MVSSTFQNPMASSATSIAVPSDGDSKDVLQDTGDMQLRHALRHVEAKHGNVRKRASKNSKALKIEIKEMKHEWEQHKDIAKSMIEQLEHRMDMNIRKTQADIDKRKHHGADTLKTIDKLVKYSVDPLKLCRVGDNFQRLHNILQSHVERY